MSKIIEQDTSVVFAADVKLDQYRAFCDVTRGMPQIGAHKVGFELLIDAAIPNLDFEEPAVYRHMTGGSDIPDFGNKFADSLPDSHFRGIVLTPTSGPSTAKRWIGAAHDADKEVYLEPFPVGFTQESGSFLSDNYFDDALKLGEGNFVAGYVFDHGLGENTIGSYIRKLKNVNKRNKIYVRGTNQLWVLDGDQLERSNIQEASSIDIINAGLPSVMEAAGDTPLVYDHQKAGNDGSDVVKDLIGALDNNGVSNFIVFPQLSYETTGKWCSIARKKGMNVIIGTRMTHPDYLVSEGGWVKNEVVSSILGLAPQYKIDNFVVPGTKPEAISNIVSRFVTGELPSFWSPGMLTQGGDPAKAKEASGGKLHAIVGRDLIANGEYRNNVERVARQLGI